MKIFKQGFTFSLIGILNTYIDLLLFNLLVSTFQIYSGPWLLGFNTLSFLGANLNSYFMNRSWTFASNRPFKQQYHLFLTCSLGGLIVNTLLLFTVTVFIPHPSFASPLLWANCAKIIATAGSLLFNFFAYRQVVFREGCTKNCFTG
jgi:putative flippase GtrA